MKLIICEFNMDSDCVELRFDDGTALDTDCNVVESQYAHTVQQKKNGLAGMQCTAEVHTVILNRQIQKHLQSDSE